MDQRPLSLPANILVISLDAAEAPLIEQWAADGTLPAFASLIQQSGVCTLGNSMETLPGAIWSEISTGRNCGQLPLYYHGRQLHSGEAKMRPIEAEDAQPENYYWNIASLAGKRVAIVDQPQTVPCPDLNGIQLFEWGLHDRNFNIETDPPEFMEEIQKKYGNHPVQHCDRHGENEAGYQKLLDGLLKGVQDKTEIMLDILAKENWDLFSGTYGETHCVGHQFWHFFDTHHPKYDPENAGEFQNAIRSVYQVVDEGVGKLITAAGPETQVILFCSHGMGVYTGGPQLLPEVLVRLGLGSGGDSSISTWLRKFQIACSHVPRAVQPLMKQLAQSSLARQVQRKASCLLDPLESAKTQATTLENNRCGAIRLNLKEREPFGSVVPGEQEKALLEKLRKELLQLKDPTTGNAIVVSVKTAIETFGENHHLDVPDLMVVFRTDLGILEHCTSDSIGEIHVPLYHPNIPRSGDHTTQSRLWIRHSSVQAGTQLSDANVLDIAPTVLHLLGVPVPDEISGKVISSLC